MEEIKCIRCGRACNECGLNTKGVVEGVGLIPLRELEKERYELSFTCEDCWENAGEKIHTLKVAGYTDKEIGELREDGYDFDERVWLIRRGHTKKAMEDVGALEAMKKEMNEISVAVEDTEKREMAGLMEEAMEEILENK